MVKKLKNQFPIGQLCDQVGINYQLYRLYSHGEVGIREAQIEQIISKILKIFDESKQTYGLERMLPALRSECVSIGKTRLSRLMKELDLQSRRKKRFIPRSTDSNHDNPVAPNILPPKAEIKATNRVWQGYITYIRTSEAWLYLSIVLDSYSRKLAGWSFSDSLASNLVEDALKMTLNRSENRSANLLFHSEIGVQYTSKNYRNLLSANTITASMSRKRNCYDNAKSESFFSKKMNWFIIANIKQEKMQK